MSGKTHRLVRLGSLVLFAVGLGLLVHRVRRTPEQQELRRYLEITLPALYSIEAPIDEHLARLERVPGLKPLEARALVVDDIVPRLLKLKHQAENTTLATDEGRRLHAEYIAAVDRLIDASQGLVHIIDDPNLPAPAGLFLAREHFATARQAWLAFDEHVRRACVRHRLAKPTGPAR